jgi:hypothetical protein
MTIIITELFNDLYVEERRIVDDSIPVEEMLIVFVTYNRTRHNYFVTSTLAVPHTVHQCRSACPYIPNMVSSSNYFFASSPRRSLRRHCPSPSTLHTRPRAN